MPDRNRLDPFNKKVYIGKKYTPNSIFFTVISAYSVKIGIGKVAIGRVRYLLNIVF